MRGHGVLTHRAVEPNPAVTESPEEDSSEPEPEMTPGSEANATTKTLGAFLGAILPTKLLGDDWISTVDQGAQETGTAVSCDSPDGCSVPTDDETVECDGGETCEVSTGEGEDEPEDPEPTPTQLMSDEEMAAAASRASEPVDGPTLVLTPFTYSVDEQAKDEASYTTPVMTEEEMAAAASRASEVPTAR